SRLQICYSSTNVITIQVMCFFFFFSSRRRHTRFSRDWSSDVCSSDLPYPGPARWTACRRRSRSGCPRSRGLRDRRYRRCAEGNRSEERRVGKECRSKWCTEKLKKLEIHMSAPAR